MPVGRLAGAGVVCALGVGGDQLAVARAVVRAWRPALKAAAWWATRVPRCSAVVMSDWWTVSVPPSMGVWAAAPAQKPRRLRSFSLAVVEFQPGSRPRLTQSMRCWAARAAKKARALLLSPLLEAELVKPAA